MNTKTIVGEQLIQVRRAIQTHGRVLPHLSVYTDQDRLLLSLRGPDGAQKLDTGLKAVRILKAPLVVLTAEIIYRPGHEETAAILYEPQATLETGSARGVIAMGQDQERVKLLRFIHFSQDDGVLCWDPEMMPPQAIFHAHLLLQHLAKAFPKKKSEPTEEPVTPTEETASLEPTALLDHAKSVAAQRAEDPKLVALRTLTHALAPWGYDFPYTLEPQFVEQSPQRTTFLLSVLTRLVEAEAKERELLPDDVLKTALSQVS